MNIQDIIKKFLDGGTLTDDERAFAGAFDLQAALDKASASARRKAESERDEKAKTIANLQAQLEELKSKGGDSATELEKLRKSVDELTKAKAESDAKVAAQERKSAIAEAAKTHGIHIADGVSQSAFEALLNLAVGETDVKDADAMKQVMETFKKDNPAMIADGGKAGVGGKGNPSGGGSSFVGNPWKKGAENLTEQMRLLKDNPTEAKRLAAAEGVTLEQ